MAILNQNYNLSLAGTVAQSCQILKLNLLTLPTQEEFYLLLDPDPDSANSQFCCFEAAPHLDRQYSALESYKEKVIDKIKKGDQILEQFLTLMKSSQYDQNNIDDK